MTTTLSSTIAGGPALRKGKPVASKSASDALSELDEILILAVVKLNDSDVPAYGASVFRILSDWDRPTSLGTIHSGLERLARKGYIEMKFSDHHFPKQGGKKIRLIKSTPLGIEKAKSHGMKRARIYQKVWGFECPILSTS